jgi:hypothetical protein
MQVARRKEGRKEGRKWISRMNRSRNRRIM